MGLNSLRAGQALGEEALPRVLVKGTREIIFFSFFPQFFCDAIPHYFKLVQI
jgi:hypothetical protein